MRSFVAFIKKEVLDQLRTGKITVLSLLFVLFGIMNPAIAKLTPWLLRTFADSLAESGMIISEVTVSALDSWVQFFKNIPLALIIFVLLEGTVFTKEYASGTLLLCLTKGFERYKAVVSKTTVLILLWTAGYWLCFGITYAYNAFFWDNSVAVSLGFSAVCFWLFGVFTASLIALFSVLTSTSTGVFLGVGGTVFASYVFSLLPKLSKYMPTSLTGANALIYGVSEAKSYIAALLLTATLTLVCFALSFPIFNKKQL